MGLMMIFRFELHDKPLTNSGFLYLQKIIMSKDAKILMQQIEQLKQEIDLLKKENEQLRSQADFWFRAANEGKPTTYIPEERN